MDTIAGTGEETIESEFAHTLKYVDIYLQQKTDLFLQHYILDPADFLFRQTMYLSVIITLLAAGTLALVTGILLFIATIVPLWAALLLVGTIVSGLGMLIAFMLFSDTLVLKTPVAEERILHGKA
jgi:hypothetical protein